MTASNKGHWIVTRNRFSFGYRAEHTVRDVASCTRHDFDPDVAGDEERALAECEAEVAELNRVMRDGRNPACGNDTSPVEAVNA